jgi:glycosyltransferase involved in cell wall biosynthesis
MFSVHIDTARTWRGGQNQALLTVLGLRERGHRAVLVAHPDGELAKRASEGHDLVRLAPAHEVDFAAGFRLSRVLRDLKPDVVHAHDPHGVSMAAMALSTMRAATRPLLVSARRVDFHLKQNAFSRWKYKSVDLMICSSEAIRQMVMKDGVPADHAVTVHEGIDVQRIEALPAVDVHKELWLPPRSPIVGNIAALVPHKGQRYLVDAAPRVVRALPDTVFLVFGEGPLKNALQSQIKSLGLERNVRLVGFRPDVLSMLKAFDVFVMSSLTEGLGTSILDAMAASKPVVGTAAGGIPEAVEHGVSGLVVPPQHPTEMADAILTLLRDPDMRARMGAAGLARARAHFTVDRMVDETLAAYERLLARPRG